MQLEIQNVISDRSAFAIVSAGLWRTSTGSPKRVAVKQVLLRSGLHGRRGQFKRGDVPVSSELATKLFDDAKMTRWQGRSSYNVEKLKREARNCTMLHKHGLAPRMYASWSDRDSDIHFGYIVMERCDGTVKDVLMNRELEPSEQAKVDKFIELIYQKGFSFGDLKPSNIGVYLDTSKRIKSCTLLDCTQVEPWHGDKQIKKEQRRRYNRILRKNLREKVH